MTKRRIFVLFSLVFSLAVFLSLPNALRAETAAEIQTKIDNANAQIKALEEQIAALSKDADAAGNKAQTLAGEIKKLDTTKKKLLADLSLTSTKVNATSLEIDKLTRQISVHTDRIEENKRGVATALESVYALDNRGFHIFLVSPSISAFVEEEETLDLAQNKLIDSIKKLQEEKAALQNTHRETENARETLLDLKDQLSDQKKIVESTTSQKNTLLSETKNKEAAYKKMIAENAARKAQFEKDIAEYEAQLKFILDPKSLPGAGALSWPLDKVVITQLFGATVDAKRLYASGTHNGIDLGISVGTPVKSMADGVVLDTGNTDLTCRGTSFGNWVTIKYSNGLASTFGHLSVIKVSAGQAVRRGDVVGYSGSSGYATGPHLHVSVYARDAVEIIYRPSTTCPGKTYKLPVSAINGYLDPMLYLPKR